MNTVLQQELIRFNGLLATIRDSLIQLNKAIEGLVLFSVDLEKVYDRIFDNRVPDLWHTVGYPSLKLLGSWFLDYLERIKFLDSWIEHGHPANYWISGFFFTQSFLTGTKQNYARKMVLPIDTIDWTFKVIMDNDPSIDVNVKPEKGAYVHGLYLDGAQYDREENWLAESLPKILFVPMPYIWIIPTVKSEIEESDSFYSCPIYKTSARKGVLSTTGHSTNFVIACDLPLNFKLHDDKHWIKRGVAMLTQLDD
jgi:dynein heavy chain